MVRLQQIGVGWVDEEQPAKRAAIHSVEIKRRQEPHSRNSCRIVDLLKPCAIIFYKGRQGQANGHLYKYINT